MTKEYFFDKLEFYSSLPFVSAFDTNYLYEHHKDLVETSNDVDILDATDLLGDMVDDGNIDVDFLVSLLDNYKSSDEFVESSLNYINEFYVGNGQYLKFWE